MTTDVLIEAEKFLRPVLKREEFVPARSASIVDRIFEELSVDVGDRNKADVVVWHGLSLLESIHQTISADQNQAEEILRTPALRRIVDALLDLVSLEGIYPRLLLGVGAPIERRVRSVLQGGTSITEIKDQKEPDSTGLDVLAERFDTILLSHRGIAIAIEQRTLVDILAAMAQLAYNPHYLQQAVWSEKLDNLINSLSPTILFPSLISLLHSATPTWLKDHITIPLSLLPMRPEGVRQTITFVAKSTPQRPAQNVEASGGLGKGPMLPLEVLNQISKVLSSIPSTISEKEYFENIAPQLFMLLEDQDPDTRRAAAFTISHGILSKKQFGHPTTVGWKCFAQPLLTAIDPAMVDVSENNVLPTEPTHALKTLSTILLEFPNPGLSKRLLSPIILPLWAIACSAPSDITESNLAMGLLKLYVHKVAGSEGLHLIANNLMSERSTQQFHMNMGTDTVLIVDQVARRCGLFIDLIEVCHTDKEIGQFFASILKKSLQPPLTTLDGSALLDDAIKKIVYSNLVREMITKMSSRIVADASSAFPIIEEVLRSQIAAIRPLGPRQKTIVTRSTLANIVQNEAEKDDDSVSELENTLSICLPWLMVVLQQGTSFEFDMVAVQLKSMQTLLETILYVPTISQTTKQALRLATDLLSNTRSGERVIGFKNETLQTGDANLHASAMKNLQATEPPIRVQGLSELESLVLHGSPLVSISSVTLTTISLLQDQDSFVYLSAVKLLVVLARREPHATLKILQEAYQDIAEQSTLDVRLRIGEALQTIFEEVGRFLPPAPVIRFVELLLHIVSRRVYRNKAHNVEKSSPKAPPPAKLPEDDSDSDMESAERKAERDVQTVLELWQGKSGAEDLRIRMSALTILGTIFEHVNFSSVNSYVALTLDIVSRILNNEKGQENAIIRRAATLTVLSILKGSEQADDTMLITSSDTQDDVSLETMDVMFKKIAAEDDDDIVRGHADNLVQAIQDWREKTFARLLRGDKIRFGLADENENVRLKGIDLNLDAELARDQKRLRKVEEID